MTTGGEMRRWDDATRAYERWAEPLTRDFARAALTHAGRGWTGRAVVDVGAGTGAFAVQAAEAGAHVRAVDFSTAMVARLHERLRPFPFCHAIQMDGQALLFEDAEFDAAFSMFGVMLFPNWRGGLAEMARVTKPGGAVIVGSWANAQGAGPLPIFLSVVQELFPGVAIPPPPPGQTELSTPNGLVQAMAAAGCGTVNVHRVQSTWGGDGIASVMRDLADFLMLVPLYVELDQVARESLRAPLRDAFLKYRVSGGRISVPVEAWIGLGVRD